MIMGGHGSMVVLHGGRLRVRGVGRVSHDAGRDRSLQPRGAEQRQHSPDQGALPAPEPLQIQFHALHLTRTRAEPYLHVTADRKPKCRGAANSSVCTDPGAQSAG